MIAIANELARVCLEIGAIKLSPENPFTWASGYRMPVYNDNRLLMGNFRHRMLVADGLKALIDNHNLKFDLVAGTATAGISPATSLANCLQSSLIYVRPAPKQHGMQNQIEGILKKGQTAIVIEDLISTGGSAMKAVAAIREAGGKVQDCLCIFNYGFKQAEDLFRSEGCRLHSLLTFEALVNFAEETGALPESQVKMLRPWHKDPFLWGENHGFPRQTQG
jgi:orotate phosphoribosyltransferase